MIKEAAQIISSASRVTVFTGAGISVESGIPPFRGENGLWSKYDPIILDLNYYINNTESSWPIIKELFYDFFGKAKPNPAHFILAEWEKLGLITEIITQNIDSLHQNAGSIKVHEFHGTADSFVCTVCNKNYFSRNLTLSNDPPRCKNVACKGLLKPNFIFFGEGIPQKPFEASSYAANNSDIFIVVGTTGEIMPASQIPILAKQNGAKIIEINTTPSNYTPSITDIFLQAKASSVFQELNDAMKDILYPEEE